MGACPYSKAPAASFATYYNLQIFRLAGFAAGFLVTVARTFMVAEP